MAVNQLMIPTMPNNKHYALTATQYVKMEGVFGTIEQWSVYAHAVDCGHSFGMQVSYVKKNCFSAPIIK